MREEVFAFLWEIFQQAMSTGDMQVIELWLNVYTNISRENEKIATILFERLQIAASLLELLQTGQTPHFVFKEIL